MEGAACYMKNRKWKPTFILISLILICSAFSACSIVSQSGQNDFPNGENAMDLPIQIAYVDNNNQNRSPMVHMMERYIAEHPSTSLEVTRFSDQDSFSKQISTELAAGTGADILLFDSFSTLNWRRLSERKLLVNLSEYTKNDDTFHEENYFQPVLDAGKIDGKQYVFPLAFNCTCLYTTQENLEDYNNASTRSYQEVLGLMSQSLQKAKEEDRIPVAFDLNTADYFTVL